MSDNQASGEFSNDSQEDREVRTGLIRGANFAKGYCAVQYYVRGNYAVFEEDILLGKVKEIESQTQQIIDEVRENRAIVRPFPQFRWSKGIVPYTIDSKLSDIERVQSAIKHCNEKTNIWLKPRDRERDYILFVPSSDCSSFVGRQGGQQVITVGPDCKHGNVIHEICHALGLWHEHSRSDRDIYIRIFRENIKPHKENNFNLRETNGDDIGDYDYGSIMHYPSIAFSRNGKPTIEARNQAPIGQREGMSAGDIFAINLLYPTPPSDKPQGNTLVGAPAGGAPS
jgi:hypothetical protein